MSPQIPYSNLELVERVDLWPYFSKDPEAYKRHMLNYYYFFVEGFKQPLGYMHYSFVERMPWPKFWDIDREKRTLTLKTATDFAGRNKLIDETIRAGVVAGVFEECCNEMFRVSDANGDRVFDMDGTALDRFGVINYGVHMIGYVHKPEGTKYWVPRRSENKARYPGMLDNTVGGSLRAGEDPFDCMVRESEEELSLSREYTSANLKPYGTISWTMVQNDDGSPGCQPQVQYLYEMEFKDIEPSIGDGEVGELYLKTLDEATPERYVTRFCGFTYCLSACQSFRM
ncbi:NUDIX hydrolase domain-like protein [Nemania sp. FL0031]|nr:NUDIX hydrolase domain-like protein [Nemania sp. FL0031]